MRKIAGRYLLGPEQNEGVLKSLKCLKTYLARKDGTDEFYVLKILTRGGVGEKETTDDAKGKTLIFTEYSVLSLLRNEQRVVHEHGLFSETIQEKYTNENGELVTKVVRRLCLVLDCYMPHDFCPKYGNIINMQNYVIEAKRIPESEAIRIFCKLLQIVERLHKLNIVHRDLKLGNMILNKDSREITLANFYLAKHIYSDNQLFVDQRGSPAYLPPEIVSGNPYFAKPSDMWATGVILFTLISGHFPIYDKIPAELFRKIKLGHYHIPLDLKLSDGTTELIRSLLVMDPKKRLTASQALKKAKSIIAQEHSLMSESDLQVVPNCHSVAERPKKRTYSEPPLLQSNLIEDVDIIFSLESMDVGDFEPLGKKVKLGCSSKELDGLVSQTTSNDRQLNRIRAMYVVRKITESAALGKLNVQMITEELANQLTTCFSSNGKTKSAAEIIPVVPDFRSHIAKLVSSGNIGCGSEHKTESNTPPKSGSSSRNHSFSYPPLLS